MRGRACHASHTGKLWGWAGSRGSLYWGVGAVPVVWYLVRKRLGQEGRDLAHKGPLRGSLGFGPYVVGVCARRRWGVYRLWEFARVCRGAAPSPRVSKAPRVRASETHAQRRQLRKQETTPQHSDGKGRSQGFNRNLSGASAPTAVTLLALGALLVVPGGGSRVPRPGPVRDRTSHAAGTRSTPLDARSSAFSRDPELSETAQCRCGRQPCWCPAMESGASLLQQPRGVCEPEKQAAGTGEEGPASCPGHLAL